MQNDRVESKNEGQRERERGGGKEKRREQETRRATTLLVVETVSRGSGERVTR